MGHWANSRCPQADSFLQGLHCSLLLKVAQVSLVVQLVKNLPAMWETWVWSLDWEDPLEEGMAINFQYSCLEKPMDRGAWWATVHGVTESDTTEWTKPSPAQHESLRIFGPWPLCPSAKLPSSISLFLLLHLFLWSYLREAIIQGIQLGSVGYSRILSPSCSLQ